MFRLIDFHEWRPHKVVDGDNFENLGVIDPDRYSGLTIRNQVINSLEGLEDVNNLSLITTKVNLIGIEKIKLLTS